MSIKQYLLSLPLLMSANYNQRFSIFHLEEGEVLLVDTVAEYERFCSCATNKYCSLKGRGRLKIGTHALYFDFDDWSLPVVRILFQQEDMEAPYEITEEFLFDHKPLNYSELDEQVNKSDLPQMAERKTVDNKLDISHLSFSVEENSALSNDALSILFRSDIVTLMKEDGYDHPYIRQSQSSYHLYCSMYSSFVSVFLLCHQLVQVNKLPREERDAQLEKMVKNRKNNLPFDITWLEFGINEKTIFDEPCFLVYPLSEDHGRIRLTNCNLYFMPIHLGGFSALPVEKYAISCIHCVRKLQYRSLSVAIELWFSYEGPIWMIVFENEEKRDIIYDHLMKTIALTGKGNERNSLITQSISLSLETLIEMWCNRKLSNYEFLLSLNFKSGRTFQDLAQYPVFPWILTDYESDGIDLTDARVYRKLDCSIGALNSERLETLLQRYEEMPNPKFLFGAHYSSACSVIHFLFRCAPVVMLKMQHGRYDQPDRLFRGNSTISEVSETWKGVNEQLNNFSELIPEFFAVEESELPKNTLARANDRQWEAGNFLVNELGLDLGFCQDGSRVDNVRLPPWANGQASRFIALNRKALESDIVSNHLHEWIDLIFGVKSRKLENYNLYFSDVVEDKRPDIVAEFGRSPEKLFFAPHLCRNGLEILSNKEHTNTEACCQINNITTLCEFHSSSDSQSFLIDAAFTDTMIFVIWNDGSFFSQPLDMGKGNKHQRRLSLSTALAQEHSRSSKFILVTKISSECVLLGTDSGSILFYSVPSGVLSTICLDAHQGEMCRILFDSNTIISSSKDGTIRCWLCQKESSAFASDLISGPGRLIYDLDADDVVSFSCMVHTCPVLVWKLDLSCQSSDDPVVRPIMKIMRDIPRWSSFTEIRQSICFSRPQTMGDKESNQIVLLWINAAHVIVTDLIDIGEDLHLQQMEYGKHVKSIINVDDKYNLLLTIDGKLLVCEYSSNENSVEILAKTTLENVNINDLIKMECHMSETSVYTVSFAFKNGHILSCSLNF
eukprot:jgi/Galph1/903/GphlegSOOS_G5621.1